MKLKLLFSFLFILSFSLAYSQNSITMRSNGMGGVGVGFQDINALFSNQAGMAHVDGLSASLNAERRFQLTDLNTYTVGIALPTSAGVFGLSVNYFGFSEFNQQKYGLVYARKLMPKFSIAGEINLHNFQILEYGSTNTMSFEIGLQYEVSKQVIVGAKIANPIERDLVNGEHLPTEFKLGFLYNASEKVALSVEVEKDLEYPANIKGGVEYQVAEILFLRVGFSTEPSLISFGLGFEFDDFRIDTATTYHQLLGWTPGLSLIYQKKKARK